MADESDLTGGLESDVSEKLEHHLAEDLYECKVARAKGELSAVGDEEQARKTSSR